MWEGARSECARAPYGTYRVCQAPTSERLESEHLESEHLESEHLESERLESERLEGLT